MNPDAVLSGSKIWGSSWREERAAAYGIKPEELEEHYRKRNVLKLNVLPENMADTVLHFASSKKLSIPAGENTSSTRVGSIPGLEGRWNMPLCTTTNEPVGATFLRDPTRTVRSPSKT